MTETAAVRILYVCSANQCRSPFAAELTRKRAGSLPVEVHSAGIETWHRGVPATGLELARELGVDLEDHVSRSVHPDFLPDYDLVLGLARTHLRELAALAPDVSGRLFTLTQLARWSAEHPREEGFSVAEWLSVAQGQPRTRLLSTDVTDDIDDPLGRPIEEWRLMVQRLIPAIDSLLEGMFPTASR